MNGMAKTIYALPAVFYFRLIGRQPNMNRMRQHSMNGSAFIFADLYGASRP